MSAPALVYRVYELWVDRVGGALVIASVLPASDAKVVAASEAAGLLALYVLCASGDDIAEAALGRVVCVRASPDRSNLTRVLSGAVVLASVLLTSGVALGSLVDAVCGLTSYMPSALELVVLAASAARSFAAVPSLAYTALACAAGQLTRVKGAQGLSAPEKEAAIDTLFMASALALVARSAVLYPGDVWLVTRVLLGAVSGSAVVAFVLMRADRPPVPLLLNRSAARLVITGVVCALWVGFALQAVLNLRSAASATQALTPVPTLLVAVFGAVAGAGSAAGALLQPPKPAQC